MKIQKTIYFAHTLSLRDVVAEEIIPEVEKHFRTVINPFETRLEALKGKSVMEIRSDRRWATPNLIVRSDLELLKRSDGTIVFMMTGISVGSVMESLYMYLADKPVVYVVEEDQFLHPWLQFHGIGIVESVDEAIKILKEYFR